MIEVEQEYLFNLGSDSLYAYQMYDDASRKWNYIMHVMDSNYKTLSSPNSLPFVSNLDNIYKYLQNVLDSFNGAKIRIVKVSKYLTQDRHGFTKVALHSIYKNVN